jgi:hypothetical protein
MSPKKYYTPTILLAGDKASSSYSSNPAKGLVEAIKVRESFNKEVTRLIEEEVNKGSNSSYTINL